VIAVFTGTSKAPGMTPRQKQALADWLIEHRILVLVHGGCIWADDQADTIAASLGVGRVVVPQNNVAGKSVPGEVFRKRKGSGVSILNPRPAPERNIFMLKLNGVRYLVAAPNTKHEVIRSGTWMTVRHGIKILGREAVTVLEP
jgi:hypothetical protein